MKGYQVYYLSDWIAGGKERRVKGLAPGVGFSPLGVLKALLGGFEPPKWWVHFANMLEMDAPDHVQQLPAVLTRL
jgi:hypothetical protein